MDVSNRPAKKEIDAALIVKSLRPVIREKRRSRALIAVIPIIIDMFKVRMTFPCA